VNLVSFSVNNFPQLVNAAQAQASQKIRYWLQRPTKSLYSQSEGDGHRESGTWRKPGRSERACQLARCSHL